MARPPNEQLGGGILVPSADLARRPASLRRREPQDHVAVALARTAQELELGDDVRCKPTYLPMNSIVCTSAAGVTLNKPV
jgi:hypothetical protein